MPSKPCSRECRRTRRRAGAKGASVVVTAGLRQRAAACVALAALMAPAAAAFADPTSVVNALRVQGCGSVPAAGSPARRHSALDAAARELARNAKLADALGRVGYPAAKSTSFHVRGPHDDAPMSLSFGPGKPTLRETFSIA